MLVGTIYAPKDTMNASEEIKDLAPKMRTDYLRKFFAEKDIPEVSWTLEAQDGVEHHLSNVVVVEHIACVDLNESQALACIFRRIDFLNGDVNDFLKHLAGAIINR